MISIPFCNIAGKSWKPAQRWWGNGINRKQLEIDVVAESIDEKSLLFGEVKWSNSENIEELFQNLNDNRVPLLQPYIHNRCFTVFR